MSGKNVLNLQDLLLNQARKERMTITVFLTNGFQFKGVILGFDNYCILLDNEGKQNLVYKHAVSTIVPSKEIPVMFDDEEDGEEQ